MDQGSSFTSRRLEEVYRLLHVRPIRTSQYHPQMDRVVEQFNGMLKAMLRKVAIVEGQKQVATLCAVCILKGTPASTGFSPFELVYGQQVRVPLDILKETWEASSKLADESIVSYAVGVQDRLSKMSKMVNDKLEKAQVKQKQWYDQYARQREFDRVLVFLPTSKQKVTPVTYGVNMHAEKFIPCQHVGGVEHSNNGVPVDGKS